MTRELQIELLAKWYDECRTNEEFAMKSQAILEVLADSKKRCTDASQSIQKSRRDMIRANYEAAVDKFCLAMQPLIGDSALTNNVKVAMMQVFDCDEDGKWLGPRNEREKFNVERYCRVIRHLLNNGFFRGVIYKGNQVNTDALANILLDSVLDPKLFKFGTIKSYLNRDSLLKDFESCCARIYPST